MLNSNMELSANIRRVPSHFLFRPLHQFYETQIGNQSDILFLLRKNKNGK